MSSRKKLSRREKRIFELEQKIEELTKDNIALKSRLYDKKINDASIIEDLEMLLLLHTTPANLQDQAG